MFNNLKSLLIAFLAALVLTMAGVVMRFLNVPFSGFVISSMLMAQAVALIGMIVLLVRRGR